MAIAVRHAKHLRLLGAYQSCLLGSYSLGALYGLVHVHRHFSSSTGDAGGSCPFPSSSSSLLENLHRVLVAPPPSLLGSKRALPSKVSLALFPAAALALAALLVWRSRPDVNVLDAGQQQGQPGRPVDTATLARLQQEGKKLLERANLGRLLSNVFAVLFLFRVAALHEQRQQQDADDAINHLVRLWLSYTLCMVGLGLVLGLIHLTLYAAMQAQYKSMKHAIRHRVRAPTSGLRGGVTGASSSTGLSAL